MAHKRDDIKHNISPWEQEAQIHNISPWVQEPQIHNISPWDQESQIRSNYYNQPSLSYNQLEFSNLYNSGQSNSVIGPSGFDSGPRNRKRPLNCSLKQDDHAGSKRFRDNRPASTGANFNPPNKFAPKAKPYQGAAAGGLQVGNPLQNKSGRNKNNRFTSPNAKPANSQPSKPTQAPNSAPHEELYIDFVVKNDVYRKFPQIVQKRIKFATHIIYKSLVGRQEWVVPRNTLSIHLKPLICARICKVMMNKEVGYLKNIIDLYNAAYPAYKDDYLMTLVANNEGHKAKGLQPRLDKSKSQNLDYQSNTVSAEHYFKINICQVIEKKLCEMITKLKQAYEIEYNFQVTAKDGDDVDVKIKDNNLETAAESTNDDGTKPVDAKNTYTNDIDNATVEEPVAVEKLENVEGDSAEEANGGGTEDTKPVEKGVVENKFWNSRTTRNFHGNLVDELVSRELWRLLVRTKDGDSFFKDLLTIMNMDPEFVKAKNSIAEAADEKRAEVLNTPLHYVALTGTPHLPGKTKLKSFLRRFHPKFIKKHRTVHNAVMIGFVNRQQQSDILNVNGSIFYNIKLSIKESKYITNETDINESLQTDGVEEILQSDVEPVEEADKLIDSDLEDEISDLLISIQESEDNPNDTTEDFSEMIDDRGFKNHGHNGQEGDEGENQQ